MKLSIFSMVAFFCLNFASSHAQQVISDEQAIKSLRHFYIFYIKYKDQGAYAQIDSLINRHCTPRLIEQLKEQDEADYDFIINANGIDIKCLNTLKVTKDRTANDIYDVSWIVPNSPVETKIEVTKIRLQLIKTPTDILIDRIIM